MNIYVPTLCMALLIAPFSMNGTNMNATWRDGGNIIKGSPAHVSLMIHNKTSHTILFAETKNVSNHPSTQRNIVPGSAPMTVWAIRSCNSQLTDACAFYGQCIACAAFATRTANYSLKAQEDGIFLYNIDENSIVACLPAGAEYAELIIHSDEQVTLQEVHTTILK